MLQNRCIATLVSMNGSDESEVYLILRSGDNRSTTSIHEGVIFLMFIFQKEVRCDDDDGDASN